MKRTISVLLSFLLIVCCMPITELTSSAATASGYVWPVDGGSMSQGWYPSGNAYGHAEHLAIDIAGVAVGTPVKAVNSGKVVCASTASTSATAICGGVCKRQGAGYHVAIQHSDGCISHYAHLNSVNVSVGATVSAGQKIGGVGNTGNSNGAHLHFAIFVGGYGQQHLINPLTKISPFSSVYAANVTSNSATLYGILGAYGSRIDQGGFYLGTSTSNMKKYTENIYTTGADASGQWITNIFYGTSKWHGTLCSGTTYYFRVWMSAYGGTYLSDIYSFKTTGSASHAWNAGSITKTASCGSTGLKTYTCTRCSTTKTETIAATGNHSYGEKQLTKKASSTEMGSYTYVCKTCSYKQIEAIPKVAIPSAPIIEGKTDTSVTLKATSSYQYSKDGSTWQSSNKFENLTPGSTYTFYQRVAPTMVSYAGDSSSGTKVTLESAQEPDIILSSENNFGVLGEYVRIPIKLDENSGFITLGLNIEYDSDVLEIHCPGHVEGSGCAGNRIAVEKKTDFGNGISNAANNSQYHTANPYKMQWAYGLAQEDITYEGEIAVITFKVKDTAALGNTIVKISADQASALDDSKQLVVKSTEAIVNVVEVPPYVLGDVDDSGKIDLTDLVALSQYVADWDVEFNERAMNVTGDNSIDLLDVVLLSQYIAGWDVSFKNTTISISEIKTFEDKFIQYVG